MTNISPLPDSPVQLGNPYEVLSAAIGGVLGSISELNDYLERVVHAVREHVTGCDEVGITVLVNDRPHTAAYTTVDTLEIDAVQYALDEGPCLDSARRQGGEPRQPRRGARAVAALRRGGAAGRHPVAHGAAPGQR